MNHLFLKKQNKKDVEGYFSDKGPSYYPVCPGECDMNCSSSCSAECQSACHFACDGTCETECINILYMFTNPWT